MILSRLYKWRDTDNTIRSDISQVAIPYQNKNICHIIRLVHRHHRILGGEGWGRDTTSLSHPNAHNWGWFCQMVSLSRQLSLKTSWATWQRATWLPAWWREAWLPRLSPQGCCAPRAPDEEQLDNRKQVWYKDYYRQATEALGRN